MTCERVSECVAMYSALSHNVLDALEQREEVRFK